MDEQQAKAIVAQHELDRWRNQVAATGPTTKPRVFLLSDLRQNAVVATVAGALQPPPSPTGAAPEWSFFADDEPNANWEHPCRYLIVHADGTVQEVGARVPPDSNVNAPIQEVFPFAV